MKRKGLLILLFIINAEHVSAQITWDTTRNLSRHEGGYGKFKPSFEASIIYNRYIGIEFAHVRNNFSLVWLLNNTIAKYYAIQWIANPHYKAGLFGARLGADMDFDFLLLKLPFIPHFGLSLNPQTDFKKLNVYMVPAVGLSWWGKVSACCEFPILMAKKNIDGNNNYQLGIKYNFTKGLVKAFKAEHE